jgi:hypothetical protein
VKSKSSRVRYRLISHNRKQLIRAGLILFAILFAVMAILSDIYEFIFVNRGIDFYRQRPYLFLLCLVFACCIGFLVWFVFRIFRNNRRGLIKFSLSLAAISLASASCVFFYFGIRLLMYFTTDSGRMAMRNAHVTPRMVVTFASAIVLLACAAGIAFYLVTISPTPKSRRDSSPSNQHPSARRSQ